MAEELEEVEEVGLGGGCCACCWAGTAATGCHPPSWENGLGTSNPPGGPMTGKKNFFEVQYRPIKNVTFFGLKEKN